MGLHQAFSIVALVVILASVVSCTSLTASEDALLIGQLYGDPSVPCVWVGDSDGGAEVKWPFTVSVDAFRVEVSGPGFLAHEGDWFMLKGGSRSNVPVTEGCPVREPQSGKFVASSVDYYGKERPSDDLRTSTTQ